MAYDFPLHSVLTAAPKFEVRILPSLLKYKKLYCLLLLLCVFVDFTFAAEDKVKRGKHYADTFFGPRKNVKGNNRHFTDYDDRTSNTDPRSGTPDPGTPHAQFASRADSPRLAPDNYNQMDGNKNLTHKNLMIEGIAQELFFHDNELNFYDADSLKWFEEWATANNDLFEEERARWGVKNVANFFTEQNFGYTGLICDNRGCRDFPSPENVKRGYPNDRHKARHIMNIMKAFEKAGDEVNQYNHLLQIVKEDLERHCEEFSKIFFHEKTKGKTWTCPAKILQIILIVIGVLVSLLAGYMFIPQMSTGLMSVLNFSQGIYLSGNIAAETSLSSTTAAILQKIGVGYLAPLKPWMRPWPHLRLTAEEDETYEAFINLTYATLSHISPVPIGELIVGYSDGTPGGRIEDVKYGGFGMMESLDTWNLDSEESSVYDAGMKGRWLFKRFPLPEGTESSVLKNASFSSSQKPTVNGRYAHRITRYFDVLDNSHNETVHLLHSSNFHTNILGNLVDKDLIPMSLEATLEFFETHGTDINARYQDLRSPVSTSSSEHVSLSITRTTPFIPRVQIYPRHEHLPWSSILTGLEFEGTQGISSEGGDNKASANLQWRTRHKAGASASKRGSSSSGPVGQIRHELLGKMRSLEVLNLIEPSGNWKNAKRDSRHWAVSQRRDGEDDVFTVDVRGHDFHNEIHHVQCGIDHYTGNTEANERMCHKFLNDVVDRLTARMSAAYDEANTSPIAMAQYLRKRFGTYSTWRNPDTLRKNSKVKDKLFQNLKNSLVSKAYADSNCFVRCGRDSYYRRNIHGPSVDYGSVACQTGCYDPIRDQYERLYGFGGCSVTSQGRAADSPWDLDEKTMNRVAYTAYTRRDKYGYDPGYVNMNPYIPLLQEQSPILPVCYSDLLGNQDALVCSCGNEYGDMTEAFAQTVNLKAETKNGEWKAIRSCLDRIKYHAYESPGKYLINACHVIYTIVAPPYTRSAQEEDDLGHYRHNWDACRKYWDFYNQNKWMSDKQLDQHLCQLWSRNAKDFDRGLNHKHPDFSYVNDMLEDHGCKRYK